MNAITWAALLLAYVSAMAIATSYVTTHRQLTVLNADVQAIEQTLRNER